MAHLKQQKLENVATEQHWNLKSALITTSENDRPPCWNSTSSFDYDLCVVVGMPVCVPCQISQ